MSRVNGLRRKKDNKTSYFDYSLLFIIIFLIGFGLVMLYSTSSYNAQMKFGDSTYYLKSQIFATILGMFAMFIVMMIDYNFYYPFGGIFYFVGFVLVLGVLSPLGMELNGARRWINLKFTSFQPAEAVKLIMIIFMAYMINELGPKIKTKRAFFMLFGAVSLQAAFLGLITNNMSSAIIVEGIGIVMVFVASPKYSHFLALGGILAAFGGVFLFYEKFVSSSFRLERIQVWMDPSNEKYVNEGGYQVLQALYAIGSGGVLGKGLGNGIQKMGFVPEAQNDMIFTIICEELGIVGALGVVAMFVFMIWRFMIIANNAPDLFGAMLVVGVLAHISIQVVLNIAVVTNTIPNTGVTLPFISYGGTSVLFLMAEMGIVLSVSRRIRYEE